jgi:hypothetical protein
MDVVLYLCMYNIYIYMCVCVHVCIYVFVGMYYLGDIVNCMKHFDNLRNKN